jgi:hypothetical protein
VVVARLGAPIELLSALSVLRIIYAVAVVLWAAEGGPCHGRDRRSDGLSGQDQGQDSCDFDERLAARRARFDGAPTTLSSLSR